MCKVNKKTTNVANPDDWGDLSIVNGIEGELVGLIRGGDTSLLINAFKWRMTRQGFEHWSDRYNERSPMSEKDWGYCEALLHYCTGVV